MIFIDKDYFHIFKFLSMNMEKTDFSLKLSTFLKEGSSYEKLLHFNSFYLAYPVKDIDELYQKVLEIAFTSLFYRSEYFDEFSMFKLKLNGYRFYESNFYIESFSGYWAFIIHKNFSPLSEIFRYRFLTNKLKGPLIIDLLRKFFIYLNEKANEDLNIK